jgi:hypothetical protein
VLSYEKVPDPYRFDDAFVGVRPKNKAAKALSCKITLCRPEQ